jgi:hypothetical protein
MGDNRGLSNAKRKRGQTPGDDIAGAQNPDVVKKIGIAGFGFTNPRRNITVKTPPCIGHRNGILPFGQVGDFIADYVALGIEIEIFQHGGKPGLNRTCHTAERRTVQFFIAA